MSRYFVIVTRDSPAIFAGQRACHARTALTRHFSQKRTSHTQPHKNSFATSDICPRAPAADVGTPLTGAGFPTCSTDVTAMRRPAHSPFASRLTYAPHESADQGPHITALSCVSTSSASPSTSQTRARQARRVRPVACSLTPLLHPPSWPA